MKDPSKFNAWFRQMVRNTAINYIRRNAHETLPSGDITETMLKHPEIEDNDPLHQLLNRENKEEILKDSLSPLSDQARLLLSSYALEDATHEELAQRFNMKKSNVYNILSRSRVKANDERISFVVQKHLCERKSLNLPKKQLLQVPSYRRPYALISILISEVLRMAGEPDWSLPQLMGISGDAFRINMTQGCSWRGISTFDWSYSTYRTFERLGVKGICLGRPTRKHVSPDQLMMMLSAIQESIDHGLPVIVWNLIINEFGFVYGYDDEDQTFTYVSYNRTPRVFRYEQLGRTGQEPPIFMAAIKKRVAVPASEKDIVASIVSHAKGKEPAIPGFTYGLQAYNMWLEAVKLQQLDLQGHAYHVAILCEARSQASQYLQELSSKTRTAERQRQLLEAAACYHRVSDAFALIYPSFPFGYGSSHGDRFTIIREGLLIAYEAEKEGISHLEKLI